MQNFKVGDKVYFNRNARDFTEKRFGWTESMGEMVKDGYGYVKSVNEDKGLGVYNKDKTNYFTFAPESFMRSEITWDNCQAGDIVIDNNGDERQILAKVDKLIFYSFTKSFDGLSDGRTVREIIGLGWELKQPEPTVEETLQIGSYTYNKKEVEEKLKDLKPIK